MNQENNNSLPISMNKIFLLLFISFIGISLSNAQQKKKWTLQELVDYAVENNFQVKKQEINSKSLEQDIKAAKGQFLPDLSANASQNFELGSSFDPITRIGRRDNRSNGFSISSSVRLFDGFANIHTYDQSKLNLEANSFRIQKMREDIALNVVNNYLQVLFNKELLKVAENQYNLTKEQLERTNALVEAGTSPKGDAIEMEANLLNDESNVIQSQNALSISLLNLSQSLQLPYNENFDVEILEASDVSSEIMLLNSNDIYNKAINNRPEIKGDSLDLLSAEKSIKIAKADYLPKIDFSYGYGSNYYHLQGEEDLRNFSQQIGDNKVHNLRFNLSVPIFNRWATSTRIEKAKLSMENLQYDLETKKFDLERNIQQSYTDAQAALRTMKATEKSLEAKKEAYRYAQERYNVGLMNAFDFNQAKNEMLRIESENIRAKYDYVFKVKVLDYYYGVPLITQ